MVVITFCYEIALLLALPATCSRPGRLSWADLLQRVFAVNAQECPRFGERLRLLAAIHDPKVIRAILASLNLPSRAPKLAPSRDPEVSEHARGASDSQIVHQSRLDDLRPDRITL